MRALKWRDKWPGDFADGRADDKLYAIRLLLVGADVERESDGSAERATTLEAAAKTLAEYAGIQRELLEKML